MEQGSTVLLVGLDGGCLDIFFSRLSFHFFFLLSLGPGFVAQSVGHLTRKSEVLGSIPGLQHTFVSPSNDSREAVVSCARSTG